MLVVGKSGKAAPLDSRLGRRWNTPRSGQTLPLNQRFSQMWQIPRDLLDRLILESSLRHAVDREELRVHLQAQADIETGHVVGMEALVRWQHPDRGLLLPAEFIPLAEETGLILGLGEWVLRTACAQTRARQEAGLPRLRVAVNLSARQFRQPDLVEMVAGALQEAHLAPDSLELEITETTAVENPQFAIEVLSELRRMGVRISLDDFGAGYSSLSYLRDLPIHALKIDQSLVSNVTREPNHAAIARAIIALATGLNLDAVAEGVETEDQLEFFREEKCGLYQGYLLGKPMPAGEFDATLAEQERSQSTRRDGPGVDPPFLGRGQSTAA